MPLFLTFRAACIHTSSGVENDPTGRPRVKLFDDIVSRSYNAMEKMRLSKKLTY